MNMSRYLAVALLLGMMAGLAPTSSATMLVFDGASRSSYFDRAIDVAQLRNDGPGEDHLRRLAAEPPAVPAAATPAMSGSHPSFAAYYSNLRARLQDAFTYRDYAAADQWRVDQAEADLALVAWELRKGRRASTDLMGTFLRDAAWALNCHIGVNARVATPAPQAVAVAAAAPTARITADPTRVLNGRSTQLSWQTTGATSATINGRSVALNGSEARSVSGAEEYVLIARNAGGAATARATVGVFNLPTASISAHPATVASGATTVVSWNTGNATTARLNGRNVALHGSENVPVTAASEFIIVAFGEGGEATDKTSVGVFNAPSASISALPATVASGATTVVSWNTGNATTARLNGRNVALQGSENVPINVASEFVIVAVGGGGEATARTVVNVFPRPSADLSSSERSIVRGQSAILTWRTTNADRSLLNGEAVAASGSREVRPLQNENYQLVAVGPGGRAEDQASVAVTTPPAPAVTAVSPHLFRIHFDFDEWAIRSDATDTMSRIAAFLRQNPEIRMIVGGHTDGRGDNEYNLALGERRARSVRDYFLAQFGLDASRFSLESLGEAEPIAANSTSDGRDNPDGRALNRRAEFIEIL